MPTEVLFRLPRLLGACAIALCQPAAASEELALTACSTAAAGSARVTLRNAGTATVSVVNPRPEALAHFADWGGWSLRASSADGEWIPYPYPDGVPPASAADRTPLEPGQSLLFAVDVGAWMPVADLPLDKDKPLHRLADVPGHYDLVVRYLAAHDAPTNGAGDGIAASPIQAHLRLDVPSVGNCASGTEEANAKPK